jgi:hypothetical protein
MGISEVACLIQCFLDKQLFWRPAEKNFLRGVLFVREV